MTRNIPLAMGWDAIYLADEAPGFAGARGKTIASLAGARGADPFDLYFDLLEASGGEARLVNDGYGGDFQDEAPLRRLAVRSDAIPEMDTAVVPVHGKLTLPLPMFWGTMPRFIARFSRDLQLVTLPEAIRRMTQLPARRARLTGRGELTPGAMQTSCCSTLTSWGTAAPSSIPSSPAAWSGSSSTASRSCRNGTTTRRRRPGGRSALGPNRRQTMARDAWTLKGGTIVDGSGGPGYVATS